MKRLVNLIKGDIKHLASRLDFFSVLLLILIPFLISSGISNSSTNEIKYSFFSFAYLAFALLVERLANQYFERKENSQ